MNYIDTSISDVKILEPTIFGDERGFFMETLRVDQFTKIVQKKPLFKIITANLVKVFYAVYITN